MKFEKGFKDGTIGVGVHIMRATGGDVANARAPWAHKTLQALDNVFTVPILIYGVELVK